MSQHRAKHRASAGGGADQLATVLIERLRPAAVPSPVAAPTRHGVGADRTPRTAASPLFQVRDGAERSVPLPAGAQAGGRVRHRGPAAQPLAAALTLAMAGAASTGVGIVDRVAGPPEQPTEETGEFRVARAAAHTALAQPAAPVVAQPGVVQVSTVVSKVAAQMKEVAAREVAARKERARSADRTETRHAATGDPAEQEDAPRVAGSSTGAAALKLAMSKIGKPYRWGAAGPNAFDCSGLVHWSFKQVGVSLPRSSSAQSKVGKRVSIKDLRPGDLVFYYSPISHVAIYVGDGKVVNATQTGKPVKISKLDPGRFTTARRM